MSATARARAATPRRRPRRRATHGSRRPIRNVVRSENAPKSGLQIVETIAPTPSTRREHRLLVVRRDRRAPARRAAPGSARTSPTRSPRLTSVSDGTQRAGGVRVGSSRAEGAAGRDGGPVVTGTSCGVAIGRPADRQALICLVGPSMRSSRKTGISRSVFFWYSPYVDQVRDRALPPLVALGALGELGRGRSCGRARPGGRPPGGRGSCGTRPGRRRAAVRRDREVHAVVLDAHHRVLAQLARFAPTRGDDHDGQAGRCGQHVGRAPSGRLELRDLLADPLLGARLVLSLRIAMPGATPTEAPGFRRR